ncbi:MAG: RNA methyltransferase [Bacteroidota bacterium]
MRKLAIHELNRLSVEEYKNQEKHPVIVVLDNIRSASNTGSFFRTADAFALEAVYLCGITAKPPHKDIRKTAIGASESVYWEYFYNTTEAIKKLKQNSFKIISVEQCEGSIALQEYQPDSNQKTAFVFGNEVTGVEQTVIDHSDACIEIPQWGTKHSLNVSISGGIILWDHLRKSGLATHKKR